LAEDIFTGVNAGSAWNRGLEVMVSANLFQEKDPQDYNAGFEISYHLARNTFRDFVDEGIDYGGKELPGIPRQVLRTELSGQFKDFSASFLQHYTGPQWMTDANDQPYEAYALTHLQLSWDQDFYSSPFRIKLYGGIRNLLDKHHASMILINAPSFGGSAPRYYYPGSPRHFYLGMKLTVHSRKRSP
jgi:iron complex outermembrane receptor protein